MAKKFRAVLPDGSFGKRNSQNREYKFCVAFRLSYQDALMHAKQLSVSDRSNFDFYCRESDPETSLYAPSKAAWRRLSPDEAVRQDADYFEARRAELRGCSSVGEFEALLIEERVAAVEAAKAKGRYDKWGVEGWQSRRDLAEKLAARLRNSPMYEGVAICAAEEV